MIWNDEFETLPREALESLQAKRLQRVAEKVYATGHTIVGCALIYRGVVIPYAVRLWAPKTFCTKTRQKSYEGEPIEYVIEILHDITEVKALETELIRERQFLASTIDQSFDGIVATDAEDRITVVNPSAEQLLGVTVDELRGSTDLERIYPGEFLTVLKRGGSSCVVPETTIRVGDDTIPVRFAGVAVRDGDKNLGTAGFLQDLREVKQLEHEKLDAERLAAVGQTVAGLAHGVKNILMGLEGGMYVVNSGLRGGNEERVLEFNKINTYKWFKENTYLLDAAYDESDIGAAVQKAFETMPMPLGVLYKDVSSTFEQRIRRGDTKPLYATEHDTARIQELFEGY